MNDKKFYFSLAGAVTVFLIILAMLIADKDKYFWDFASYYYAGKTASLGQNAYDVNVINQIRVSDGQYKGSVPPFVYPNVFLSVFKFLSALSFSQALYLFLGFKLTALALLMPVWIKLLKGQNSPLMPWIVLLGFGSSLLIDFLTGNISTFEQLFLWVGIYNYLNGRYKTGVALMAVAGSVKTVLLFMPFMLVLLNHKKEYMFMATAFVIMAAMAIFNYLTIPLSSFSGGAFNSPAYVLIKASAIRLFSSSGIITANLLFIIYTLVILVLWILSQKNMDNKSRIMFLILVYSLISPRFSDYSFLISSIPLVYFSKRLNNQYIFLIPALIPSLVYGFQMHIFFMYIPFLIIIFLFGFIVRQKLTK